MSLLKLINCLLVFFLKNFSSMCVPTLFHMFLSFQFYSKLLSVNEIGYTVGGVGAHQNVAEPGYTVVAS
jgi:hypothetical protein